MNPPKPPPPAASADAPAELPSAIDSLVDRPPSQRLQESKYRFGQAAVFGVPVLALQWFGRSLGGAESDRWVAILQALLAGWVVYVGSAGMVSEGILILAARRRAPGVMADLVVGLGTVALFTAGVPRLIGLVTSRPGAAQLPATFHWSVIVVALWSGLRWSMKKSPAV